MAGSDPVALGCRVDACDADTFSAAVPFGLEFREGRLAWRPVGAGPDRESAIRLEGQFELVHCLLIACYVRKRFAICDAVGSLSAPSDRRRRGATPSGGKRLRRVNDATVRVCLLAQLQRLAVGGARDDRVAGELEDDLDLAALDA